MTLPILISVPHAGLVIPNPLRSNCLLSNEQVILDGDQFASEIYMPLEKKVASFICTDIARAVLDMNRAEDQIYEDGVIKTQTCWNEPIWHSALDKGTIDWLLDTYHRPYHQRLSEFARDSDLMFAVDCHTMAAFGPPVGPDPGTERPQVCLGNANGMTCTNEWLLIMQSAFQVHFPGIVTVNQPFSGGYITQYHGSEMQWIQLEISRSNFASPAQKSRWVLAALTETISKMINER